MGKAIQTLDELLGDPTIQLVMARDGWAADDIRLLLAEVRARGAGGVAVPPAYVIGPQVIGPHMAGACRAPCRRL